MGGQDWDEDVLPEHWIYQSVGRLDTGRECRQSAAGYDDPSLMQHAREHGNHQIDLDGIVIFRQVPVVRNAGKVEIVGRGASEHLTSPGHIECQSWHRQPRAVNT